MVEEEPRKIQTELPALLQDLGTSRLLAKYKQSLAATVNQSPANQEIALPVKTDLNDSKTKKSRSNSNDSSSFSLLANSEPPPHNLNKSITVHTTGELMISIKLLVDLFKIIFTNESLFL